MKLIDMSNKLKDLEMPLPDPYLVHYIMLSLRTIFDNFKINYNGSDKKWNRNELTAKYCQEEERLSAEHKDFVNLISQDFNRNHGHTRRKERERSLMRTPRKKVLKKSTRTRVLSATIAMIGAHKEGLRWVQGMAC
jgi:hypothetical protein